MIPAVRMFEVVVATAFYSGICYMVFESTARQFGKFGIGSSMFARRSPEVLVLTAIHSKPCIYPEGDHLNLRSIINKQDYARLHKYHFISATTQADATLDNMWNKVGWLLKAYHEHPEVEWFMWIDSDTMVINPTFELPFHKYKGRDLVIWGNETALLAGDGLKGMNSGVMLFRRSAWMETFLEQVATLGRIPEPKLGQILKKELTAPGYMYDAGLRDQNAIVYILKTNWQEHGPHVLLVNKQYCLNCYWRDLLKQGDLKSDDTKVNFINHFSGCQLCTQQNKDGDYAQCESEFVKSFEYADGIYSKLLKRMPPRDIAHEQQLAATPYCKENPRAKECRVAVTAVAAYKERQAEDLRSKLDSDNDLPVSRRALRTPA